MENTLLHDKPGKANFERQREEIAFNYAQIKLLESDLKGLHIIWRNPTRVYIQPGKSYLRVVR